MVMSGLVETLRNHSTTLRNHSTLSEPRDPHRSRGSRAGAGPPDAAATSGWMSGCPHTTCRAPQSDTQQNTPSRHVCSTAAVAAAAPPPQPEERLRHAATHALSSVSSTAAVAAVSGRGGHTGRQHAGHTSSACHAQQQPSYPTYASTPPTRRGVRLTPRGESRDPFRVTVGERSWTFRNGDHHSQAGRGGAMTAFQETSQGRRPNEGTVGPFVVDNLLSSYAPGQTDAGRRSAPRQPKSGAGRPRPRSRVYRRTYASCDGDEEKEVDRAEPTQISSVERNSRERDSGTDRCEELHSVVCNTYVPRVHVRPRSQHLVVAVDVVRFKPEIAGDARMPGNRHFGHLHGLVFYIAGERRVCPCVKGPRWVCAGGTRTTTQTVVGHNPQQRMATTKSSNFCGSPCLAVFRFVTVAVLSLSLSWSRCDRRAVQTRDRRRCPRAGEPPFRPFAYLGFLRSVRASCVPVCIRSADGLAGGTRTSSGLWSGMIRRSAWLTPQP